MLIKKRFQVVLCGVLGSLAISTGAGAEILPEPAKNVIVIMTDGTGSTHTTISRWMKGEPLTVEQYLSGGIRTFGADSIITDSAPAATAFATGNKSNTKLVGVLPYSATLPNAFASEQDKYRPYATVLEAAKLKGKSTGIIATSNVQHASPAGYSAHTGNRSDYHDIAMQQVYQDIDVVFGGGSKYLLPTGQGGTRPDSMNLVSVLKNRGYGFVETRSDLMKWQGKKVWGLFAPDAMAYEMDRSLLAPEEPSLAEMTGKAIEVLSKNPEGFFLFVEASKVDWASHANDPIGVVSDVLAWDDAFKVAVEFAKKNPGTLVIAFSDHGNGGMSLGSKKTDTTYDKLPLETLVGPLKQARLTGEGIEKVLGNNRTEENIRQVVGEYFGVKDLTAEEIGLIQNAKTGNMNYALGPIISNRSVVGWTTNGHTGEDLFLYTFGPGKYSGTLDNTELAVIQEKALGTNLEEVDRKIYQEAAKRLPSYQISVDTQQGQTVLTVSKNGKQAILPCSTDILKMDGKEYYLSSLTLYAKETNRVYISEEAAQKIRQYLK